MTYANARAEFWPAAHLASNTTFTATIKKTVASATGVALAADYSWKFTTGDAVTPGVPVELGTAGNFAILAKKANPSWDFTVKMSLSPGDRIALLGANGAGKSTFIKLLAGVSEPLAGERIPAKDLRIGYFAQHQLEQLDMRATPVDHLKELDESLGEKAARDFLGGFGFSGLRALDIVEPSRSIHYARR